MATNLAISNELIERAVRAGKHKTKRAAVEDALQEYIQRREQLKIADLMGTIDYYDDYDYKKLRHRK